MTSALDRRHGASTRTLDTRAVVYPINSNGVTRYVIMKHRLWLPGLYESEAAAKLAFRFCVCHLERLGTGVVTYDMLTRFMEAYGFECDRHLLERLKGE